MYMTQRGGRARREGRYARRYRALAGIRHTVVAGCVLHACACGAAAPSWRAEAVHYLARNTPLSDVLREVANAGGLQIEVARGLKGPVNGEFDEPPSRVFARLIEAYGLVWYYDGHIIHVFPASDSHTRTIPFAPMSRDEVANLLASLELDDSHLPVRYSDTTAVVSGPGEFVDAIEEAISQAQRQTTVTPAVDETVIRVFPLRYAQAQDITYTSGNRQQTMPGVASLLRQLMADVPVSVPDRPSPAKLRSEARAARGGPPPLPSLRGLGLADTSAVPELDVPLPGSDPLRPAAPPTRRNIVADARTNSVVIYDVPSMMPSYERTIAMLDKPQDLVEITAAVIDVSSDAASDLGIRWGGGTRGGSGYAAVSSSPAASDSSIAPVMPGLNLATMIGSSASYLFAKIHALEQDGKARILSRPQVLTLNNSEAILSSHSSVYVRVAGNQDVDLYNVDTGLTLKVTPTVECALDGTRKILLNVQIDDGAFDSSQTVDGIPRVNNHSIVTQAVIVDGESLLLGGYQYEQSQQSSSEVPVLGDIPYIGALFRDDQTQGERAERLILITPRIKTVANEASHAACTSAVPAQQSVQSVSTPAGNDVSGRATMRLRVAGETGPSDGAPPLPPGLPPGSSASKGRVR